MQDLQGPPHRPPGLPPGGRPPHRGPVAADDVLRPAVADRRVERAALRASAGAASSWARSAPSGGDWQLTNPQMVLFGADGETSDDLAALSLETIGPLYPLYPATKDVESWDLQKAISFARTMVDEVPELLPERRDGRVRRARRAHRARPDPRPRDLGPDHARPSTATGSRRPWSPSSCWAGAAARCAGWARSHGPAGTARCWRRSTPGCRGSSPAGSVEIGAQIERDLAQPLPDEPAAPGRGRLRQDPGRAAGDAAGRRLRRPGRAARAHRGAGPAAPPVDHRAARRPGRRRDARRRRRRRRRSSCSPAR